MGGQLKTILLVEDDAIIALSESSILENAGEFVLPEAIATRSRLSSSRIGRAFSMNCTR
jgi:hypothetical protein